MADGMKDRDAEGLNNEETKEPREKSGDLSFQTPFLPMHQDCCKAPFPVSDPFRDAATCQLPKHVSSQLRPVFAQ